MENLNWKSMTEGKPKYAAYLASREWAILKVAVKGRSKGVCEHCRLATGTQTHHMTYERKYAELLTDLLHVCEPCHKFLSGISDHDPRPRRKIYFAGKVGKNCWRHGIVKEITHSTWIGIKTSTDLDNSGIIYNAVKINNESFDYVGPFFVSCDHGCYHGKNSHGTICDEMEEIGHGEWTDCDCVEAIASTQSSCGHGGFDLTTAHRFVSNACLAAIDDADIVFAWIAERDCFATLAEVGFAVGKYKPVWIGFASDELAKEMWFLGSIARSAHVASTAKECLDGCHDIINNSCKDWP